MTPQERAKRSAKALWSNDHASQWLGFTLAHVDEDAATLPMGAAPHNFNGRGTCHGGIIFALADSAFAFACNSRNQPAVAQHNIITYIAALKVGVQWHL